MKVKWGKEVPSLLCCRLPDKIISLFVFQKNKKIIFTLLKIFNELQGMAERSDKGNLRMMRVSKRQRGFVLIAVSLFFIMGAMAFSVSILSAQNLLKIDTVRIKQLTNSTYLHNIPFDSAVNSLNQALALAQQTGKMLSIAKTFKRRGDFYYDCSHYRDALNNYHHAETIYQKSIYSEQYIEVLIHLCDCFSHLSQPDSLLIYTMKGLSLVNKTDNNQRLLARLIDKMGFYYEMKEDYSNALTFYYKALAIVQKINNHCGIAREKINIGIIYDDSGDTIKAIQFYKEALKIGRRFKMEDVVSACLSNLSNLKSEKDTTENDSSGELISMEIDKKNGDNYGIAIGYNNIGVSKNNRGQYEEAKADYLTSYALSKKYGFQELKILNLYNLGYFFLDSTRFRNPDSAIHYLNEAERLSKKLHKKEDLLDILALLKTAYQQKKEYKKAYQIAMAYEQLDKVVYTQEKDKKLSEIMVKFQTEQEEKKLEASHKKAQTIQLTGIIISISFLLIIFALSVALRLWRLKNRKLAQQKQFAESLFAQASSYVIILSKSLKTVFINSSFQLDFGYDKQEMKPEVLYQKLHPEDRILLINQLDVVQKQAVQRAVFECRIKNGQDNYRCIAGIISNKLHDKILNGLLINFWDVTELKEKERLLGDREKKYRNIFEAFPDVYFRENTEGILTEITPSVEIIFGFKPKEILGKNVIALYQNRKDWWMVRKEIAGKGEVHDYTLVLLKKDGTPIITSINAKVLFDDNGQIIGVEGVMRDMTDRENRAQQLQEANATKDKLFSIIAHDLVGPIGVQKNIIDLILWDIDSMPKEEIVPLIISMKPALDATFFMIENLLSWARIMRKSIEPRITGNTLYTLVAQIFKFLQAQADKKHVHLIYRGDRKIKAFFDKNMMDIVLRNLITNAMKFSSEESAITVAVEQEGEKVRISVIDRGIGIPPDILKNLNAEKHKSYSRLGTKNEKGTGIGLIVVKEFIHKHKSQLTIESQVGKGSVFSFELPVA